MKTIIRSIVLYSIVLFVAGSALAVDTIWDDAFDGSSWDTLSAWSAGIPSAATRVFISDSSIGDGPHIDSGCSAIASNLYVGIWGVSNHVAYLIMDDGTLNVLSHVYVGVGDGAKGYFEIGGGSINVGGNLYTGFGSTGNTVIRDGSLTITNWLVVGQGLASGTFSLEGGAVSANVLGINSNSTLNIAGGVLYLRGMSPAVVQSSFVNTGKISAYEGKSIVLVESYGAAGSKVTASETLRFMHCDLPADQYIQVHAEKRTSEADPWTNVTQVYQPFRSKVNLDWKQVYWRKDALKYSFYGELFTFDNDVIRLHTETFPAKTGIDSPEQPAWDARYDRCRLFVDNSQPSRGVGREIMPVGSYTGWQIDKYVDTYLCNNFDELNDGTAPLFQHNVHDNVTVELSAPFSTVYDGESLNWPASGVFTNFDEALIVNQTMNNNSARERFIFARKGSVYFGIVRWDFSIYSNGQWVVTRRATGLDIGVREKGLSFGGFFKRARANDYLLSHPKDIVDDINGDDCADFLLVNGTGGIFAGLGREDDSTNTTIFSVSNPWGSALTSQQIWNKPLGVGDVNGDGISDYVFVNGTGGIWAGQGSTNGTTATFSVSNPWGSAFTSQQTWNKPLGVGDVNGDGFSDYVFVDGYGEIHAGLGSSSGGTTTMSLSNPWQSTFTSQQSQIKPLGLGDINGDSYSDIVCLNANGEISVIYSMGNGETYAGSLSNSWPAAFTSIGTFMKPLFVGDANADEYADVAVIDQTGRIFVMLTDGADVFSTIEPQNPWGSAFTSQSIWNISMQIPFGWWFTSIEPEPIFDPEILSWSVYSTGVMKMVVNAPSTASRYSLQATTDLAILPFTHVAHSDNGVMPFVVTNLAYSTAEGTNEVIYVETAGPKKFFKIIGE